MRGLIAREGRFLREEMRMNQIEAVEAAKSLHWARWVAMDDNGRWYAYSARPYFADAIWHRPRQNAGCGANIGEIHFLGCSDPQIKEPIEVYP